MPTLRRVHLGCLVRPLVQHVMLSVLMGQTQCPSSRTLHTTFHLTLIGSSIHAVLSRTTISIGASPSSPTNHSNSSTHSSICGYFHTPESVLPLSSLPFFTMNPLIDQRLMGSDAIPPCRPSSCTCHSQGMHISGALLVQRTC